jgi:probable HAF family extracellular repeat protein
MVGCCVDSEGQIGFYPTWIVSVDLSGAGVHHGLDAGRFKEWIAMATGHRAVFAVLFGLALAGSLPDIVRADALYTITGLGTLPGTTQSIATGINASGQITGVSYTSSNGTWTAAGVLYPLNISYDGGAQSFLYSSGQMTQINPVDGPANAINASGQVVGGHYSSINDSGQYVGGAGAGFAYDGQYSLPPQLVSGGATTNLPIDAYAINNSGEVAGWSGGTSSIHAVLYQNGTTIDLSNQFGLKGTDDAATAISNTGYAIIAEGRMGGSDPIHYLFYNPTGYHFNGVTGPSTTDLTALTGGSGKIALALNNQGQVVGNGFLYSDGQFVSLQSLLSVPLSSQWSNLNATGINDAGQIVGQGLFDGQEQAFVMTPDAGSVPEPSSIAIFALMAGAAGVRAAIQASSSQRRARDDGAQRGPGRQRPE